MIEQYLKDISQEKQKVILQLRATVFRAFPNIKEDIKYKMPTYSIADKVIVAFAAQKNHFSVYIMDTKIKEKYATHFEHLSTGKSCIRFTDINNFPIQMFEIILKETQIT